jgi:hypothetical protein
MRVSGEVPVCFRATTYGFVLITSVKLKIIVNELLPKASIYNVFVAARRQ